MIDTQSATFQKAPEVQKVDIYKSRPTSNQIESLYLILILPATILEKQECDSDEMFEYSEGGLENSSFLSEMIFPSESDTKKAHSRPMQGQDLHKLKSDRLRQQQEFESENFFNENYQFHMNFETDFLQFEKLSIKSETDSLQTPIKLVNAREGKSTTGANTLNSTLVHSVDGTNPFSRNDVSIDKKIFESLLNPNDQANSRFGFAQEEKVSDYGDEELTNILKESAKESPDDISYPLANPNVQSRGMYPLFFC